MRRSSRRQPRARQASRWGVVPATNTSGPARTAGARQETRLRVDLGAHQASRLGELAGQATGADRVAQEAGDDRQRRTRARQSDPGAVVEADPDGHHQLGGVAHEPGVAEAVGGARLPGHRARHPEPAERLAGATLHRPLQRVRHQVGLARVEGGGVLVRVAAQGAAVGLHHRQRAARRDPATARREHGVGARDLERGHLEGTQREARDRPERALDAGAASGLGYVDQAHLHAQPGEGDVQRVLQGNAEGDAAAEAAIVIGGCPGTALHLHLERSVLEQGRQRERAVPAERGERDERLEYAARLAPRTGGPVEGGSGVVAPAHQGQHVAGGGIERDQGGLERRRSAAQQRVALLEVAEAAGHRALPPRAGASHPGW